jgi:hypothetical protein
MNITIEGTKKVLLVEDSESINLLTEENPVNLSLAGTVEGVQGPSGIVNVVNGQIVNIGTYSNANIGLATVQRTNSSSSDNTNFVQSVATDSYGRVTGTTSANITKASTSQAGIASFDSGDFSVSSGVVTIKPLGVDNSQLVNSTISGVFLGSNLFSLTFGNGLSKTSSTYNGSTANSIAVDSSVVPYLANNNTFTGSNSFTGTNTFSNVLIQNANVSLPITTVTNSTTLGTGQYTINCKHTSDITLTLPAVSGTTGRVYNIKHNGSGIITIAAASTETIDGSSSYAVAAQYRAITIQSTGTEWIII